MRIPLETPLLTASRRLQPLSRWYANGLTKRQYQPSRLFIPHFEPDTECLFRRERQTESLNMLKMALLLGASGFFAFIILDLIYSRLSLSEVIGRFLVVLMLGYLFLHLHKHPKPERLISIVAKLSAVLSVAELLAILLAQGNPVFYSEIWVGVLPIYFFTYGQMFMTLPETLFFGIAVMIALPFSGYLVGVGHSELISSTLILLIVNVFGFCTRKKLEADARNLFQERRKAERSSENKTLFLKQFSHNLRQPLQALSCYASVMDAVFANKPDDLLKPLVGKMGFAIDELNNAFNHVLDIANLESGLQIPLLTAVDINVLLAALEDQFAPQAAKRGLQLIIRLRADPPYTVYSDASILRQIIGNLVDNAIKYTIHGRILVKTVNTGGNRLRLHVCDTGIGITEEQTQSIFKEFYRGHRRFQDQVVYGMGIGLAYVLKAINSLADHSITLSSIPNRGSNFRLSLPLAAELPAFKNLLNQSRRDLAGTFVYLVDDDPKVLNALYEQLSGWGCLVQKANSLAEIKTSLDENFRSPDLLITDFYLEDNETAHDIIAAIEADCGPVPVLILSAHAISAKDKAKLRETTLLLRKPASSSVLMEMMAKAMGK
jgi:two-component system, sensor histidine kinase